MKSFQGRCGKRAPNISKGEVVKEMLIKKNQMTLFSEMANITLKIRELY